MSLFLAHVTFQSGNWVPGSFQPEAAALGGVGATRLKLEMKLKGYIWSLFQESPSYRFLDY